MEEIKELKHQLKEAQKAATEAYVERDLSRNGEDQEFNHVLVLIVANLESLIKKAGVGGGAKVT